MQGSNWFFLLDYALINSNKMNNVMFYALLKRLLKARFGFLKDHYRIRTGDPRITRRAPYPPRQQNRYQKCMHGFLFLNRNSNPGAIKQFKKCEQWSRYCFLIYLKSNLHAWVVYFCWFFLLSFGLSHIKINFFIFLTNFSKSCSCFNKN